MPTSLSAIVVVDSIRDQADVSLNTPSNGQVLTYNSVSQKWENQTPTGGFQPEVSKIFTYNVSGQLETISDAFGVKTLSYSSGRLSSISGTGPYPNKVFSYDVDGRLISIAVS